MSKLVIASIGPASSVQDGGRPGSQRYGLVPSGAMDRLALAAANTLVGNEPFAAADRDRSVRGNVHRARRRGARRAVGSPAQCRYRRPRRWHPIQSATLADGETLTLGFARNGSFSYLAIEGGIVGEPMFGSLAVNARAGLGSPYPRPLQAGDELAGRRPPVARRNGRIELPTATDAPIRVVLGAAGRRIRRRNQDAVSRQRPGRFRPPATAWATGSKAPCITHLHGHNIVSDGTVNGSLQVPGNGQPIVLMPDRGTTGGYPKIATVISADFGRFAQIPAGRGFRFKAVSMAEAQAESAQIRGVAADPARAAARARHVESQPRCAARANVAGSAVSAVDAGPGRIRIGPD